MKTFLGFTTGVFVGIVSGMSILIGMNATDEYISEQLVHNGKWYKQLMSENENKKA